MPTNKQRLGNFALMKAAEQLDINVAKQVISSPEIDQQDLAFVLEDSIMGRFKDKDTGETVQLDNSIVMKGLLNLINRFDKEEKLKS